MSRTLRLKLVYASVAFVLGGLALLFVTTLFRGHESLGAVTVGLVLLLPGRLQAFFLRKLFRGRRLLDSGEPKQALEQFFAFLDQLSKNPWQKALIWLSWAIYTPDVVAMAWNNIGACHTNLGNFNQAKRAFLEALVIDPKYPLPHLNLARIAIVEGDRPEAEHQLEGARSLGYSSTSIDQLVDQAQALLARIEGAGVSSRVL